MTTQDSLRADPRHNKCAQAIPKQIDIQIEVREISTSRSHLLWLLHVA